jgi:Asparagine synthase (glutamine-hydrolyzing)
MNNNSNKNSLINEKFAKETNVKELFISLNNKRRLVRNSREFHYLSLDSGGIQRVLEILDKSAAAANLEARYPFFDKRLMEFCLALPVEQKINKGWDRFIMRRSMEQILPSEIQWRATKANLGPNFQKNFLLFEKSLIKDMVYKQNQIIENYVNLDVLREMYCNYSSQRFVHASKIFMVVNLMLWLEYQFTKINK